MAIMQETLNYAALGPITSLDFDEQGVPPEALRHFSEGVALLEKGNYQDALDAFEQALEHKRDFVEAWRNKGAALARVGRYHEALDASKKAITLSGDAPDVLAWLSKGAILASLGRIEEAQECYDKVLGLNLEAPAAWAWLGKGLVLCQLINYKEAHQAFQNAFNLRNSLPDGGTPIFEVWSRMTLTQGLDALLAQNVRDFEEAGLKYIDILEKAQQDGMGRVVEDALSQCKAELKKKRERKAFEELEVFINLVKIKDPFEGWRAIGESISEKWPTGHSVVKAVREMRR